jgi:hypothetical protein
MCTESNRSIPTSLVLAKMAGDLTQITVATSADADPQLIIFTSSEAMTRKAVEALRRAYPAQLIQESIKPGRPSVLHAIQDMSLLKAASGGGTETTHVWSRDTLTQKGKRGHS